MELVKKNGKVIEMANRASIQKLSSESLSGLTTRVDNHESGLNTNAHQISNIAGLQTELNNLQTEIDGKATEFTGYTGSLEIVTSVNFIGQSTTTATLNIDNGIITSIS